MIGIRYFIMNTYTDVASEVQAQRRYTEVQRRRHANALITGLS